MGVFIFNLHYIFIGYSSHNMIVNVGMGELCPAYNKQIKSLSSE